MPASIGEFEASLAKTSLPRQQIMLAYAMDVKHIIVVVNKMDTTEPPYSQLRFDEIKTELLSYLNKTCYQPENISFIPVSSWHGDNLIEPSDNMPWFKGWTMNSKENNIICKTLLEVLDNIVLPKRPVDKPLRLSVATVHKTRDTKTMIVGRVETGILKPNMIIRFAPSNLSAQVKSIQMYYETLQGKIIIILSQTYS
jgi:elongation factor 1-alpha